MLLILFLMVVTWIVVVGLRAVESESKLGQTFHW